LDKQEHKPDNREYTIKIIPHQGETVHSIRLPIRLVKYGIVSLAVGLLLFVGAASFAVYSVFTTRNDATEIGDLRQVNGIQQEQMLQLSKKANALQDQMDQLGQTEDEIRRMTGVSADDNSSDEAHDGQGGPYPYVEADAANVKKALDRMENDLAIRKDSVEQLGQKVKEQQDQAVALGGTAAADGGIVLGGAGANMPSIWPASGVVSSPFGMRWGGSDFHPGIDIANDSGTPIRATADGTVVTAGWNSGGYGNMVDIDHGNGIMTRYGHAEQVIVTAGQFVRKGQVIAYMGSTGFSTGPHVHYEVHVNGQVVNPVNYL
jgi:murein DD-endopeptidase MepM/ murein hydrolase activator NlpD